MRRALTGTRSAPPLAVARALVERMAARLVLFAVRHASLLRPLPQPGKLQLAKVRSGPGLCGVVGGGGVGLLCRMARNARVALQQSAVPSQVSRLHSASVV